MRRFAAGFVTALLLIVGVGKAQRPPRWWVNRALCVHSHEGSWAAATGNGYYGGLQMDLAFQRTYGGWILAHQGTANNWKPITQLIVGWRGYKARGWQPWPRTARICGLL